MKTNYKRKIEIVRTSNIVEKIFIEHMEVMSVGLDPGVGFTMIGPVDEQKRVLIAVRARDVHERDQYGEGMPPHVNSGDWRYATLEDIKAIMEVVEE